jgi:hypothetical protein
MVGMMEFISKQKCSKSVEIAIHTCGKSVGLAASRSRSCTSLSITLAEGSSAGATGDMALPQLVHGGSCMMMSHRCIQFEGNTNDNEAPMKYKV